MKKIITSLIVIIFSAYSCKTEKKQVTSISDEKKAEIINQGKLIAKSTFLTMSGALQKAMKEGGVSNAVDYCNIKAMDITDSLATHYDVDVKRTSLKYRNPANKPTAEEIEILNTYQKQRDSGTPLEPVVVSSEISNTFHAPIITAGLCISCHGDKNNIENYEEIFRSKYPNDLATGYEAGDLRGMWSITFYNKNK